MEKRNLLLLFTLITSMLFGETNTCFTYNQHNDIMLKSGESFYQDCRCEEFEQTLSTKNLKWYGPDNQEIFPAGPELWQKASTEWGHRRLSLFIPNLNKALAGTYKCVSNGENGRRYTISYKIDVYEPLYFVQTNRTQYITYGQDSLVRCQARGHTQPVINWHRGKDDLVQIFDSDKYNVKPEGLLIKNVTKEDADEYHCSARVVDTTEDVDRTITVQLMTPPKIENMTADPDTSVIEGDPLILDCKATGYPLPTYYWRKLGMKPDANQTWYQNITQIVFDNVTIDDQGIYQCIVQNKAGESRTNISIEVLSPPTIVQFSNIDIEEGYPVTVTCGATGRPKPNINITYFAPEEVRLPDYNITSNETYVETHLTFDKVMKGHEGFIVCNATNSVGYDVKTSNLTVFFKPYFDNTAVTVWAWPERTVNLTCEHHSKPSSTLQWSYTGNVNELPTPEQIQVNPLWTAKVAANTEHFLLVKPVKKLLYGTYECLAKNNFGEAKKVFNVKEGFKPSEVPLVNKTEIAATSATFELINTDTSTGPPIIGYTALYNELEMYNKTNIHENRTWAIGRPYKIDKLKSNTAYFVRFAAINEIGTGPFSLHLVFRTPEKSAPEPVSIAGMKENSSESIIIPANKKILPLKSTEHNGSPIDSFVVKYCPEDGSECFVEEVAPTAELELSHLENNTSYKIEIVAHNSLGNSTPTTAKVIIGAGKQEEPLLSAGAIIGISIVVVVLALLLLDLLLFLTRKQGMIANCFNKKNKDGSSLQSKDKKGLLKDNTESGEIVKRPDNGHKEYEYNKSTGAVTGKQSAV